MQHIGRCCAAGRRRLYANNVSRTGPLCDDQLTQLAPDSALHGLEKNDENPLRVCQKKPFFYTALPILFPPHRHVFVVGGEYFYFPIG
jgi:hypothetical protein